MRVVDPERWGNTKLAVFFIGLLIIIAGIGGLESNDPTEPLLPFPGLFFIGVLICLITGTHLGPPKR
ncbi:MAG: hypothetical protein EBZ87_00440 [Microbacteriaceae bacterium]|nr:hypothetical protein [Microbacteriaceae bacterium]